jgi:hypothetical protein
VEARREGGSRKGLFALAAQGGEGLVVGVVAPGEPPTSVLAVAAEVIGSFRLDSAASAGAVGEAASRWTDATNGLSCEQPGGWRLRGGLTTYDGKPAIALQGSAAAGDAWFAWAQPLRPVFRELTAAMRRLGFRDGDSYYAYDGMDPRMVMTRGSAADLVTTFLLPERLGAIGPAATVVGEAPLEALSLIGGADDRTSLVTLAVGPDAAAGRGWCIISQAAVGESPDGWFWEAACLAFGGAPGHGAAAAQALRDAIRSAAVGPGATPEGRAVLEPFLARATAAVAGPTWRELVGSAAYTPELASAPDPTSHRATFTVPPEMAEAWRRLARGEVPL